MLERIANVIAPKGGDLRASALRWILDRLVDAADEALNRSSEQWLRQAAACVGNALTAERRGVMQ